jgi:uncharacterized protein (TIRG00374 family)
LNQKNDNKTKILRIVISIIVGALIVWLLLSQIELKDIPKAIADIPLSGLIIAFCLYAASVMFKALRFKIILRNNIGFWRISSIVSLYMLFANVLPMRAGELSYMYLLKKNANTPGTKSFASLITGAIADAFLMLIAMILVAWHLRSQIVSRSTEISISGLFSSLLQKLPEPKFFMILAILALIIIIVVILLKWKNYRLKLLKFWAFIKSKSIEIFNELTNIRFDLRLLGIIFFSVLIIVLRFGTQWVIVRSMNVEINIWQFSFAILFGVLFSLLPIHGPAGFGTVEAPWVLALAYLGIPSKDAIISGFSLHIIIILFCVILGLYGAIGLGKIKPCGLKIEDAGFKGE